MNIWATIEIRSGGPGSGCSGPHCGRPKINYVETKVNQKKLLRVEILNSLDIPIYLSAAAQDDKRVVDIKISPDADEENANWLHREKKDETDKPRTGRNNRSNDDSGTKDPSSK